MTTIEELKQNLQTMIDQTENKAQIEQIGKINGLVDTLERETQALRDEQKDLLKDYKELIKHTSFAPNGTETQPVHETKELEFEDFLVKKN